MSSHTQHHDLPNFEIDLFETSDDQVSEDPFPLSTNLKNSPSYKSPDPK